MPLGLTHRTRRRPRARLIGVFAVASIVATIQAGFGSFASFSDATQTVNAADVSLNVTNITVTGDAGGTALTETVTDMMPGDFRERLIQLSANTNFAPAVGITVSGTINNDPTLTTLAGINQVGDSINVLSGTNPWLDPGQPGGTTSAGQGGLFIELYSCAGTWSSVAGVLASSTADRDYTCSTGANGTLLAAYDVPTSGSAPTQWVVPPLASNQTILVRTRHTNDTTTDGRQNTQQNEQVTLTHAMQGATPDAGWTSITSGGYGINSFSCGIKSPGTLWCWGENGDRALGIGALPNQTRPYRVGSQADWTAVASGSAHTCGIRAPGTLWCWGTNTSGQLGLGDTALRDTPVQVGSNTDWASVDAGVGTTCATTTSNNLFCWGHNATGQIGNNSTTPQSTPTSPTISTNFTLVSVGGDHTCGRRTDATLWCWGRNDAGQLGIGNATQQLTPTQSGVATDWTHVSTGGAHTCGRRAAGAIYCWGVWDNGQLGTGQTSNQSTPQQVGTETDWSSIGVGINHSCTIKNDGRGFCWGWGVWGALGNGSPNSGWTLTQVGGTAQWSSFAGHVHRCGIDTSTRLWCWGLSPGGLGLGDTDVRMTPNLVTTPGVGRSSGAA
jgi:alpha-tubulin suppressor-like RCC1 family protein